MTLSQRARRAQKAKPADHWLRSGALTAAALLFVLGVSQSWLYLVAAGSLLIGLLWRPDAERYYLEGFTDGAQLGEEIAAADHHERARERYGALRERLGADEQRGADGGAGSLELPDPGDGAIDGSVFAGRQAAERIPAPRLLSPETGDAIPRAAGPRPADFPIPPAQPAGLVSVVESPRATTRREVDFRFGTGDG